MHEWQRVVHQRPALDSVLLTGTLSNIPRSERKRVTSLRKVSNRLWWPGVRLPLQTIARKSPTNWAKYKQRSAQHSPVGSLGYQSCHSPPMV